MTSISPHLWTILMSSTWNIVLSLAWKNGIGHPSSNLEQGSSGFNLSKCSWGRYEPISSPTRFRKTVGSTGVFCLFRRPVLVNKFLTNNPTCNITEQNELIYAGAKLVCKKNQCSPKETKKKQKTRMGN